MKRLNQIEFYRKMMPEEREKLHALFSDAMIDQVNQIDIEYGYDFKDPTMMDSFIALNKLPKRDMRRIVMRIFARKPLA